MYLTQNISNYEASIGSISKHEEYDLPSKIFSELREGGARNKNVVEAIVHCPGKKFDNGKSWFVG